MRRSVKMALSDAADAQAPHSQSAKAGKMAVNVPPAIAPRERAAALDLAILFNQLLATSAAQSLAV